MSWKNTKRRSSTGSTGRDHTMFKTYRAGGIARVHYINRGKMISKTKKTIFTFLLLIVVFLIIISYENYLSCFLPICEVYWTNKIVVLFVLCTLVLFCVANTSYYYGVIRILRSLACGSKKPHIMEERYLCSTSELTFRWKRCVDGFFCCQGFWGV